MRKIPLCAAAVAFALGMSAVEGCASQPTPTMLPVPSRTPPPVAVTVTIGPSPTPRVPPTATRILATLTPTFAPTAARPSNEPPPVSITLILAPEPNLITATFTARGNQTLVELNVRPVVPAGAYAAVIYEAFCAQPGTLRYTLANVVDGKSATTINAPMVTILSGALNLDIKRSPRAEDGSLACIRIPEAWLIELKEGSQTGAMVAFDLAGGTEVDAFIKPGPPGVAQPALIYLGTCKELGAIRYSLNPIVDGVSRTLFGTRFLDFKKEKGALNVHKSLRELESSVACGLVTPAEAEERDRQNSGRD